MNITVRKIAKLLPVSIIGSDSCPENRLGEIPLYRLPSVFRSILEILLPKGVIALPIPVRINITLIKSYAEKLLEYHK
jgi:hypothetical protein